MKSIFIEKSLGMDIREESVSLTLIGKKLRAIEVLAGKTIALKPLTGKDEKAEKHFLNKVNRFLVEHDTWPESVVVSLPRSYITFKTFELLAPDLESVQSMVEFELERQFSSGLEDLYFTYQITQKYENTFHIASAAIKKEIANYFLELVQKLNLTPTILDVSTFANVNLAFSQEMENDATLWALADISPENLDIALIKNNAIEFSRSRSWDWQAIKDANSGESKDPAQLKSLSSEITKNIIEDLQQALSSCRSIEGNELVGHIFITGGGVLVPHIRQLLEKETEVSTTVLNTPESITPNLPESFSPSLMLTSLGLSLRELKKQQIETNLLPADQQPKRKKVNIKLTLAMAVTVVLLLAGWFANKVVYTNKTLTTLDEQLNEIKGQVASLEKIDLTYDSLKQYVDILNTIKKQYPNKLPVLGELTRTLPRDTWLTHLNFKQREVEVKGFSPVASKLIPLLEQSKTFVGAGFLGTIIKESAGEKFTIRADLESGL
ncbi:MAG: pilus assembly protein PilM [Nitrospina sp.]|jgi:Tfp pilus assembly PilM family ATPase/Tfp pilus assembly protein PilN|nr:pilus assembly protein PilM [Nitrospina sp.]MBT3875950.1 pilus assembly protein PilM [Nitrospina sp.]MBT4049007.1 pilus assembly protein PilM [Nitrospina sp.]MBT4557685.1 pilus assembly protein PilM [Nitrospina sp.]MBT5349938.1 pilus assembly protein PilM [Nitrospina sp.]